MKRCVIWGDLNGIELDKYLEIDLIMWVSQTVGVWNTSVLKRKCSRFFFWVLPLIISTQEETMSALPISAKVKRHFPFERRMETFLSNPFPHHHVRPSAHPTNMNLNLESKQTAEKKECQTECAHLTAPIKENTIANASTT